MWPRRSSHGLRTPPDQTLKWLDIVAELDAPSQLLGPPEGEYGQSSTGHSRLQPSNTPGKARGQLLLKTEMDVVTWSAAVFCVSSVCWMSVQLPFQFSGLSQQSRAFDIQLYSASVQQSRRHLFGRGEDLKRRPFHSRMSQALCCFGGREFAVGTDIDTGMLALQWMLLLTPDGHHVVYG